MPRNMEQHRNGDKQQVTITVLTLAYSARFARVLEEVVHQQANLGHLAIFPIAYPGQTYRVMYKTYPGLAITDNRHLRDIASRDETQRNERYAGLDNEPSTSSATVGEQEVACLIVRDGTITRSFMHTMYEEVCTRLAAQDRATASPEMVLLNSRHEDQPDAEPVYVSHGTAVPRPEVSGAA